MGGMGILMVFGCATELSFNLKAEVTQARVEKAALVRQIITSEGVSPIGHYAELTKTICEADLVFSASNGEQIRFTTERYDVIGCIGNIGRIVPVAYDPADPSDHRLRESLGLAGPIGILIVGVVMILIAIAGFVAKLEFRSQT